MERSPPVPQPGPGVRGILELGVDILVAQDGDVQGGEGHLSSEEHQEN